MSDRYRIMDREECEEIGLLEKNAYKDGFGWAVVRFEGDRAVEVIGEDGGEPEDQLLIRDWRWVAPALNAAFERGRVEGARLTDEQQALSSIGPAKEHQRSDR